LYERGQRVALRDHQWEITDVRAARGGTLLEVKRLSEGAGAARTLTVVPELEDGLRIQPSQPLRFAVGNPIRLQQLHDALRLTMAHGRGDLVALEHGRIELEAYQLIPVLKALRLPRARLLIADDVGLGKTIEAGLVMLELARRGRAARVLVACPAALTDQWVEEMVFRFNLEFTRVDGVKWQQLRRENPASQSPWAAVPLAVSSIDYLKANTGALHQAPPFDLVIIDEAHHVARAFAGQGRTSSTDRSRLARLLATRTRELLLLSATPHNGYPESFASLLQLLEPYLAADDGRLDPTVLEPFVVRRLKGKVARGNPPRPVTPGRSVNPIPVHPTAREQEVFQRLRGHSQRTLRALREDRGSYQIEAFTLEILRKRALSSPFALAESLRRRADALAGRGERAAASRARVDLVRRYRSGDELDEQGRQEAEQQAMAALAERMGEEAFGEEQRLVDALIDLVARIRPEDDAKLSAVKVWLREFHAMQPGERVILFTEFVDTLTYLAEHLGERAIVRVDGTLPVAERRRRLEAFGATPGAILLATDAAGEGLNLQEAAHTVLHYELPWNPNRLEQRNGRVDRYGQTHRVQVRYLHLEGTRDAEILERLRTKLARIQAELGSASDVLGLANQPGLIEALLEGEDEDAIERRIDQAEAEVRAYLQESGALAVLAGEAFGPAEQATAAASERRAARLTPSFAEYTDLVRRVVVDEGGAFQGAGPIWQVTPGPRLVSYRGVREASFPATFDRSVALDPANKGVAFLTPAHPLVRAVLQRVRTRLWESGARDRVAVRVVAGQRNPGYLVTFTARVQGEDGSLLEEPLLPVWVGVDGAVSRDPIEDEGCFHAPRSVGDGSAWARGHLEEGFDRAVEVATAEAQRRLDDRAAGLAQELQAQVARLGADLELWRAAEQAEAYRRFQQAGSDGAAQLGLFVDDPDAGALATLDQVLAAIEETFTDRVSQLARAHRVGQIGGPDVVGCLLVVPEALAGGER
jgi:SNF2 family DNA or RNA helicase